VAREEQWLGEAGLPWNILLAVDLPDLPEAPDLQRRLATLTGPRGWRDGEVLEDDRASLLTRLASIGDDAGPLTLGRYAGGLVVRAHHAHVDGLGLLAVLREVAGVPASSDAAGVSGRPPVPTARALARRLVEVASRPPAPVAAAGPPDGGAGDVLVETTVPGLRRTSEVAAAALAAVAARNLALGAPDRHLALAVGVSTTGGASPRVADDSGFLRFTDVEGWSREQLGRAMRTAPLQVGGTPRDATARRAGGAIRLASRLLADRLGSTLLVSHLGTLQVPGALGAAFHPVSGGGSGVSLGAVGLDDATTLTLRARGRQHGRVELAALLADVAARLEA
jgi:hypothetical protein